MIRRPPRSTPLYSSAASDVYKRQASFSRVPRRCASCSSLSHALYCDQFLNCTRKVSNDVVPSYLDGRSICLGLTVLIWSQSDGELSDVESSRGRRRIEDRLRERLGRPRILRFLCHWQTICTMNRAQQAYIVSFLYTFKNCSQYNEREVLHFWLHRI